MVTENSGSSAPEMAETPDQKSPSTKKMSDMMAERSNQNSPVTETVSDVFVLHGYAAAKAIGVGKYIASDEFTLGGCKWAIYFYPEGEDNLTYVSAYVKLLSEGRDVQPVFELTLMDQSGKGNHMVRSCFNDSPPYTHEPGSRMWGYKHFFMRTKLETSVYLRDDYLKIFYTVGVAALPDDCSKLYSIQVPDSAQNVGKTCSVTEMTSGSNLFVIQGYSTVKGIGVGNLIASNEFTVGGYKWLIHFYPDGKILEDNSTHVSVFVALASEGRNVRALFELTLMDQSGKGKHMVNSCFLKSLTDTLCHRSEWGYKHFFERATLETSDYLRDDCLKIYCTVGVVSAIDCSRRSIKVPDSDMVSDIGMLLDYKVDSDITFNVSGEKLYAHKMILAARSPTLMSELIGVNTKEVMVRDMEADVFKALLHFIYKDALAENEVIPSALRIADTLTAKLMAAANRFDLGRLKRLCESHMCKYITVNSVMQVLVVADSCHAEELKDVCLKFAAQNLAVITRSGGFKFLQENYPSLKDEVLKIVGGSDEAGSNSVNVSAPFFDGGDDGSRVRRRGEDDKAESTGQDSDGNDDGSRRVKQKVDKDEAESKTQL